MRRSSSGTAHRGYEKGTQAASPMAKYRLTPCGAEVGANVPSSKPPEKFFRFQKKSTGTPGAEKNIHSHWEGYFDNPTISSPIGRSGAEAKKSIGK